MTHDCRGHGGPGPVIPTSGIDRPPAAKHRVLLAALLLRAGRPVAADRLADALWDGAPPPSAAVTMRNYVSRLRRALGPAGSRIVTRSGGHLIDAGEDGLDVLRFAALREQAAAASREGSLELAAGLLGEALELWRGPVPADVPSDALHRDEPLRSAELRLDTAQSKLEAEIRLGAYGPAIAELRVLTAHHPGRERFWAQLMIALSRDGRRAEALAAYRDARRALAEDFGVEPGAQLREAHRLVLEADAAGTRVMHRRRPAGGGAGTVLHPSCPGPAIRGSVSAYRDRARHGARPHGRP